jgi:hypothetical protein
MTSSTHPSATNLHAPESEAPKVEALFLIRFDKKIGYGMRQIVA